MSMKDSLSQARFARYLRSAGGDEFMALELYRWNTLIAQSLYVYLQCWEITFRNRVDSLLRWKYGPKWPYDDARAIRNLTKGEKRRLSDTKARQSQQRMLTQVPTDAIVADLSAGFWVSLLSSSHEISLTWHHNIRRVFPHDVLLSREVTHQMSERILTLRNRIAHHEPIFDLPVEQTYSELQRLVSSMCVHTDQFARNNCTFPTIANQRPAFLTHPSSTPK